MATSDRGAWRGSAFLAIKRRCDPRIARRPQSGGSIGEHLIRSCVRAQVSPGNEILLHVPSGTYLRLEGSASAIVDLLVVHGDGERVAAELVEEYGISLERASSDVADVIAAIAGLEPRRRSKHRRPTLDGTLAVFRQWWRLPGRRRVTIAEALAVVLLVEVGLRAMDIERLGLVLGVPLATGEEVPASDEYVDGSQLEDVADILTEREHRGYWAANWVLDRWLYDGTCLRRALVTGHFLRKRHPSLHLGLTGDQSTSHAWIEAEGMVFNSEQVSARYRRVNSSLPKPGLQAV